MARRAVREPEQGVGLLEAAGADDAGDQAGRGREEERVRDAADDLEDDELPELRMAADQERSDCSLRREHDEVGRHHDEVARQAVGPDAADEDEEDLRDPDRGEHDPQVGGRAVQVVEDGERERDGCERAAEQRCGAADEEEAERALAESAEAAHAARSRRFSAQRRIPRYECQNGIACAYEARCSGGSGATSASRSSMKASCSAPASISADQRSMRSRSSARCRSGSLATPKWTSASRCGRAALDLVERLEPGVAVELGRRCGREDELARLDADARRVAGVERPVGVEVADVVPRMAGRGEALEAEHAGRRRRGCSPRAPVRARPRARRRGRRRGDARSSRAGPGRRGAARRSPRRGRSARDARARGRPWRRRGRGGCARAAGGGYR